MPAANFELNALQSEVVPSALGTLGMNERTLIFSNALALILLMVLAPAIYAPRIERDVEHRCRAELARRSIPGGIVAIAGRDVFLDGKLRSSEQVAVAEELVWAVSGVRRVVNRLGTAPLTPESRAGNLRPAFCEVIVTPSRLFVLGLVPDEPTHRLLLSSLDQLGKGREIESRLEVAHGVGGLTDTGAVAEVTAIVAGHLNDATFRIEGGTLTLKGSAPDESTLQALVGQVSERLPLLEVRNQVTIAPVQSSGSFAAALTELFMDSTVEFESESEILTPASLRTLDRLVELLQRFPGARVAVAVPVQPSGDAKLDLELRELRAQALTGYFRLRGVGPDRYRVPRTDEMALPPDGGSDHSAAHQVYVVEDR